MALSVPLQCALSGTCGLAFGVAFDKTRVFQPDVIVDQARRRGLDVGAPPWRTRRALTRLAPRRRC
jgi:hypothetical protein